MQKPHRYTLEMFMEQGSEGVIWYIYDNTLQGYEGLVSLENGMEINIIGKWRGIISMDYDSHKQYLHTINRHLNNGKSFRDILHLYNYLTVEMSNKECEDLVKQNFAQPVAGGYYCHWTQRGVDPDEWASWFKQELPVEIISR